MVSSSPPCRRRRPRVIPSDHPMLPRTVLLRTVLPLTVLLRTSPPTDWPSRDAMRWAAPRAATRRGSSTMIRRRLKPWRALTVAGDSARGAAELWRAVPSCAELCRCRKGHCRKATFNRPRRRRRAAGRAARWWSCRRPAAPRAPGWARRAERRPPREAAPR
eukprot:scaffold128719_cov51-Phaeocystis_antarctica.AAC.2